VDQGDPVQKREAHASSEERLTGKREKEIETKEPVQRTEGSRTDDWASTSRTKWIVYRRTNVMAIDRSRVDYAGQEGIPGKWITII